MGHLSLPLPESLHEQQRAAIYRVEALPAEDVERQRADSFRLLEKLGPSSHEAIREAPEAREPEPALIPEFLKWLEQFRA